MALSGDMLRSHRRKKVETVEEAPQYLYDIETLRRYKQCFTKPPPGLKDTDFVCVFRHERSHHPGFSRDMMKATLSVGENAWQSKQRNGLSEDEEYTKSVRGMLNKLTPDKYDSVTKAFDLTRTYKDENKIDIMVAAIFDKALSEPTYSQLYVRLCLDIYIAGGEDTTTNLFRKRIIGHAQREFFETMKRENEEKGLSKRQNANIKFVCELVSVRVLSTKVIHFIVDSLLTHEPGTYPTGSCIEMLTMIITTIGKMLDDNPAEHAYLTDIISQVQSLLSTAQYPPRTRFMLMDILDLKERNWIPRMAKSEVPAKVDQHGNPIVVAAPPTPAAPVVSASAAHAASVAAQRSKLISSTVKSSASFASIVGGNPAGGKSANAASGAGGASGSGFPSSDASSSVSGAPPSSSIDPVLLEGEAKEQVLSALLENDPTSVSSMDPSSALLTAQMDYCKSGKREENILAFVSHAQYQTVERVEALSSCLATAIVEDVLSDVPKFQERWANLVTKVFDVKLQIHLIVETVAQCIQKVLFCEEEGKTMDDTCSLAMCLDTVWISILHKVGEHEATSQRTDELLRGLENVFNVPNLPIAVADALMNPLKDTHKSILVASSVQEWIQRCGLTVAGQKLKSYLGV